MDGVSTGDEELDSLRGDNLTVSDDNADEGDDGTKLTNPSLSYMVVLGADGAYRWPIPF